MNDIIDNYFKAQQDLYDHVGFTEDWVIYPIASEINSYWYIDNGDVHYADSLEELETEEGNYYNGEIYTQRFYKKHVYKGEKYTMIFVDTHTDCMKYFMFFDNLKEVKK